jgi:general secretion pathway protein C
MIKICLFIINGLLVLAAVYSGATFFYNIFVTTPDKISLNNSKEATPLFSKKEARHPLSFYDAITHRNLFNTKDKSDPKTDKLNIDNLKQTELNVKLWGTVTGPMGKEYAVIEDAGKKEQNLYQTGDPVQHATLKIILRNKVVLDVNGKDEILEMEDTSIRKTPKNTGMPPTTAYTRPPLNRSSRLEENAQPITLKRSYIINSGPDMLQLVDQNLIKSSFDNNGEPDGIALSNVRSSAILRQMRLRNGDIISEIDGKKTNSMEDIIKLFDAINTSSEIKLQIKRRGQIKNFKYQIK